MPVCFIISPIGESGSETRQNADDLRDLLIKPVLEPMGFDVVRGDHRSEVGQIDIDVIRAVQEADLCIADISLPNANVFYEFGRRDETGKPLILLKAKGSMELPVDVATRRYIEYDLDSRRGIIGAMEQLRAFVTPMMEKGFESSGTGASLSELAEILKRIERKLDRVGIQSRPHMEAPTGAISDNNTDPIDLFKLAMQQRNIPMAEQAMEQLAYRMERYRWLDQVVESVAAMGSIKAGDIMIENAEFFMDSATSFKDKTDYLGCLVSNLNRTDREMANLTLVEHLCESMIRASEGNPAHLQIQPYNQLNRLYHGIYTSTKDKQWILKAIRAIEKALHITDDLGFLHYNLGFCLSIMEDHQSALKHTLRCVELDGDNPDDDHLEQLCTLLHKLDDPRLDDYLCKLEEVNGVKAQLLRVRFRK